MVYQSKCQSIYMVDKVCYVIVLFWMNFSGQLYGVNIEYKGCCNSVVDFLVFFFLVSLVVWLYWVLIRRGVVLFNQYGDNIYWVNIIRF